METGGKYWFVNFQRSREQGSPLTSTHKIWAATLPQAMVRASEEYAQRNSFSRAQADAEMIEAGLWDA